MIIGLTATPCRGDGRGLGGIFETIVECPQVAELIEQKHLVKTRVFAPVNPDLRGVETRVGDYVESQLAERMDKANLVGDIVSTWHKHGERQENRLLRCERRSTRCTSATSSSDPALLPNTSTARFRSRTAMQSWRGWPRARRS